MSHQNGTGSRFVFLALVTIGLWRAAQGTSPDDVRPVLVTGATGRTGVQIYNLLKDHGIPVRAFVRDVDKARERLNCTTCDEEDGIFVGDLTQPDTIASAVAGAGGLVIASGAVPICTDETNCTFPEGGTPHDIDWVGNNAQLSAFANAMAPALDGLVVYMSSMGTTNPVDWLPGDMHFYKLNMEASLMASGLPFVIVKPCGLSNDFPRQAKLLVGHDDSLLDVSPPEVPRGDVARVIVAAFERFLSARHTDLRFDLCSKFDFLSKPTTDKQLPGLLEDAKMHWGSSLTQKARGAMSV